jgi:Mg2+-importing ATPase
MTVVPEALPVITTVSLSNGALQLAKHKVVVKRLSAIESLGRINILCTDKTGTLTQDQLFITEIVSDDEVFFQKIAYATIEDLHVKGTKHFNSFDRAFIAHVPSKLQSQVEDWEQLSALPFDPSARRRRVILHSPKTDETYLVTIGSTEAILGLSQVKTRRDYRQLAKQAGQEGKRQLAIAYKLIKYTPDFDILRNESGMTFLGFASLIDPLRPTAKATIALAKELGVEVKILTGDSPEVAACIGRQVGLLGDKGKVYTGTELDRMTAAEFDAAIIASDVFARVTPEQKYHIIKQLKLNNVVGYQGDGINDAPSLKLADASIAVKNASDVAKYSADIILSESDLSVIINGIHYGRSIFININKYIRHAMTGNIGNFFSLTFFYVVFSTNLPLLPIQLLVANLLQDMPLATIFSDRVDEAEVDKPLVASHVKSVVRTSMILGTFTAIFYFVFFMFIGTTATDLTRTSLFLFFNLTQLLVIISVRRKGFFWRGAKPSKPLLIATLLFIASSVAIIYVPSIAQFFSFVPLSLPTLALLFVTAAAFLFLLDLTKVGMYKVYDLYQQRKVTPIVSQ